MTETQRREAPTSFFPWAGLLVLAAAVFLSITIEMLPTGLLPDMSRELEVAESQVGLLVTVFAFAVVITSTPLVALTRRVPRHALVVIVLAVLAISNLLTALAPNYELVLATRVLGGAAHGLFWAVVGAYAGHLVPKEQIARAVAITTAGGSLAFVLGVPLGTALGHAFGWRTAFAGIAALTMLGAVLVWLLLPRVDHRAHETDAPTGARSGLRGDPTLTAVVLVCVVTAVTMIGQYAFYTYIAPYMIEIVATGGAAVSPLLFAYGIAGAIGLLLAGTVLGKHPTLGLLIAILTTGFAVGALAGLVSMPVLAVAAFVLWGIGFGALPPLLNTRLLHTASARIRDAAAAFYTTAFNTGIGGGALLGAVLYDSIGLASLPWAYVGILVLSSVIVLLASRMHRRRR
ncbi:MFS transporter [Luethyella okanaganae]|uniref:MFS transporter n=1 Tax=Luethyella okanaganae TaxID=69372 RepID=A0ABW1VFV3_9MICO